MVAQLKNLPAMQETWVWSLGWEDLPEKGMATHSSILAWRIWWMEEPSGLQSVESQKSRTWLSDFRPDQTYGQLIYDKGDKNLQGEKTVFNKWFW